MPRPLLSCAALICCCLLLFAPSPSSAAASAEGALQSQKDATKTTTATATATTTAAAQQRLEPTFSSFSSSSATARHLGSGRFPASIGSRSFSSSSIGLGRRRRGDGNDENRSSSFSVVDPATTAMTATAATFPPRSRPSHHHRRRRRRSSSRPATVIDIYVRTYRGDAAWLTWLLRSIEANVEEGAFRKVLVSVPRGDAPLFESLLPLFRLRIVLLVTDDDRFERATKFMKSPTEDGGYHAQMWDKLTRPPLYSDADYFVHVDSDCVFKRQPVAEDKGGKKTFRKISRLDFVDARGRVRVRRVAFASLPDPFHRWQRAAEVMLLEPVPYETMSCFPLVFPREVYGMVRDLVLERHKAAGGGGGKAEQGEEVPLLRVLSRQLDDFGEFTAMGHVLTTRLAEGERWIPDVEGGGGGGDDDKSGEPLPKGKEGEKKAPPNLLSTPTSSSPESFCSLAQQAWSWGTVTAEAAVEAEKSLRVGW